MPIPSVDSTKPAGSRFKRIALKIVGGFLTFLVAVFGIAMLLTNGLPKSANAFFDKIAVGDLQTAYNNTSVGFRKETSYEQFNKFVTTLDLKDYESSSWNDRSIDNDRGTLKGSIKFKKGSSLPMSIQLVKEAGDWKINGLTTDAEKS